ncbi:MAG: ABC transporter ATP-binding protein, partial [Clostridium sp.]
HLDVASREWMEEAVETYDGALLFVSHDRYFLDRVVNRIFAFEGDGRITQYEGGFTDYQRAVELKNQAAAGGSTIAEPVKSEVTQATNKSNWKDTGNVLPKKKKFTFKEQKDWETIDDDIAKLEDTIASLEEQMAAAATNYAKLNQLMTEKAEKEQQLEEKMDRWMYLNELMEEIESQK